MPAEVNTEKRCDSSSELFPSPPPPPPSKYPGKNPRFMALAVLVLLGTITCMFTILKETNMYDSTMISIHHQDNVVVTRNVRDFPEYNEEEALEHVYYSKVAFCTEHAITSWSCGDICERAPIVGRDKIRYIPEGERFKVQGYVAQIPIERSGSDNNSSSPNKTLNTNNDSNTNSTKCMVSFRGSLNGANWYADFLAMLRPWPLGDLADAPWCRGCKAHTGFAEAYDELRADVHRAIAELNCTRLVLTGHSLGAAIATIASFDLRAAMGYKVEKTWTFGKPRIGNAEFVNSFVASATDQGVSPPLWRVVHYHDPVPRAPPHLPGIHPVAHGALEVYYTDRASSQYIVCPQQGAIENQSGACMGGWPLYLPINIDHINYLNQTFAFKDFPEECKRTEDVN